MLFHFSFEIIIEKNCQEQTLREELEQGRNNISI